MATFTGSPLAGFLQGTDEADTFIGTIDSSVLAPADISGAAILYAAIDAKAGDDLIEGTTSVVVNSPGGFLPAPSTATAYGVSQSSIKAGSGNDTVTISASGSVSVFSGGTGISYGLYQSFVDTGSGNDTLEITGSVTNSGFASGTGIGYGIYRASLNTGQGDDTLVISGSASSQGRDAGPGNAYGVYQASVDMGKGDDALTISGSGSGSGFSGGTGNGYGVYQASVDMGDGDNTLEIIGSGSCFGGGFGTGYGVYQASVVTGSGNDTLTISGLGLGTSGRPPANATGYGVYQASVVTGNGNDTVTITGSGSPTGLGFGTGYGVYQASVDMGKGDDTLTIIGSGLVAGNVASSAGIGYGVYQASVSGGSGNDSINISGTNFGIKDALISGDEGNDSFNVGRGQGTVDGGLGFDTLQIDYFVGGVKPSDITVRAGSNGDILISGKKDNLNNFFDANGNSNAWSQTIKGVEQFAVNGVTYTASQFVQTFGYSFSISTPAAELTNDWWTTFTAIPASQNPLVVGATVDDIPQSGNIHFLGGLFGSDSVTRHVSVANDQTIVIPILTSGADNVGWNFSDSFPELPVPYQFSIEDLKTLAGAIIDTASGVSLTVNGALLVSDANQDQYRLASPSPYSLNLPPEDDILGYRAAGYPAEWVQPPYTKGVQDGIWVALNDLPLGENAIHFTGEVDYSKIVVEDWDYSGSIGDTPLEYLAGLLTGAGVASLDVTYQVDVLSRPAYNSYLASFT